MSSPSAMPSASSEAMNPQRIRTLVSCAMLTAIAYVVMYLSKLLPQVIGFLQFDLKDTVICIGGFIFGPLASAAISVVVALIEMITVSDTGPWGLLMNIIATCSFCCTASWIYKKKRTMGGAVLGLACGTLMLGVTMVLWNYLATPIYMGLDRNEVVAPMLLPVFLPFNLVKGGLNTATTLLLYKPVVSALRSAHLVPPSESSHKAGLNVGFLLFSLALLGTFVFLMLVLAGLI